MPDVIEFVCLVKSQPTGRRKSDNSPAHALSVHLFLSSPTFLPDPQLPSWKRLNKRSQSPFENDTSLPSHHQKQRNEKDRGKYGPRVAASDSKMNREEHDTSTSSPGVLADEEKQPCHDVADIANTQPTVPTTTSSSRKASPMHPENEQIMPPLLLWRLPDAVLFHLIGFVAPPTHRAAVICHQLAPLTQDATRVLLRQDPSTLWEILLRQDYGAKRNAVGDHDYESTRRRRSSRGNTAMATTSTTRRACKRLRRSILQRVQMAHSKSFLLLMYYVLRWKKEIIVLLGRTFSNYMHMRYPSL